MVIAAGYKLLLPDNLLVLLDILMLPKMIQEEFILLLVMDLILLVWLMLLEYMVYTAGIAQLEKEQKVFDESWYWYCSNNSSNTRVFDADGRAKGKISTVRSNFVLLALGLKKVNTARRIYNC
ncbi:hypothetical protein Tco_0013857 [Tanacetum coccineum]